MKIPRWHLEIPASKVTRLPCPHLVTNYLGVPGSRISLRKSKSYAWNFYRKQFVLATENDQKKLYSRSCISVTVRVTWTCNSSKRPSGRAPNRHAFVPNRPAFVRSQNAKNWIFWVFQNQTRQLRWAVAASIELQKPLSKVQNEAPSQPDF